MISILIFANIAIPSLLNLIRNIRAAAQCHHYYPMSHRHQFCRIPPRNLPVINRNDYFSFFVNYIVLSVIGFLVISIYGFVSGSKGVPDMTVISDIDEDGINKNLQARYSKDLIYVSFSLFEYGITFFM